MRRKKTLIFVSAAALGLAAVAGGQLVIGNAGRGGFNVYDSNVGSTWMLNQLWSHAQMLESEVLQQRKSIADLEKDLKSEKEKFTKLERRVRNMELRGK